MNQKTFIRIAAGVFALVALAHFSRIFMGWSAVIAGWTVPMWLSWFGLIVAGGLSYCGFAARN